MVCVRNGRDVGGDTTKFNRTAAVLLPSCWPTGRGFGSAMRKRPVGPVAYCCRPVGATGWPFWLCNTVCGAILLPYWCHGGDAAQAGNRTGGGRNGSCEAKSQGFPSRSCCFQTPRYVSTNRTSPTVRTGESPTASLLPVRCSVGFTKQPPGAAARDSLLGAAGVARGVILLPREGGRQRPHL